MSKQKIAVEWKIVEIHFDPVTSRFVEKHKKLGRFTAATAREKVDKMYPTYKFKEVDSHGFGGRWVDLNYATVDVIPA